MANGNITLKPILVPAVALAWLVPGAGHWCIGRRIRGIIIFLTIGATFWAGAAIGGVMTVDNHNEKWWFIAQMFTGVHGLSGWQLQKRQWSRVMDDPSLFGPNGEPVDSVQAAEVDQRLVREGIALTSPTDTIARAYAGVAGLLNLLCIFDVAILGLMGQQGEPRRGMTENKDKAA
jgi:hypothetical protein